MAKAKTAATKAGPVAKGSEIALSTTYSKMLEEVLPENIGLAIRNFLANAGRFLQRATELEQRSEETLAKAKLFTLPKNGDEDAALQAFIKNTAAEKREVEDHWGITSIVHRLHRAMTARRDRSVKMLDEAQNIPNRLHNTYVDAARRKAEEDTRRERERVEREAEEARRKELEALERKALEAEAASEDLSERELAFVDAYVSGLGTQGDGTAAARRAGYKDPFAQGARLLASEKVRKAIEGKLEAIRIRDQKQVVAEEPVIFEEPAEVKADIEKVGVDVTRWKAEVVNERLFIEAVIGGQHGIPADVLTVNKVALNEYARSLKQHMNRWPGVRAVSTTKLQ